MKELILKFLEALGMNVLSDWIGDWLKDKLSKAIRKVKKFLRNKFIQLLQEAILRLAIECPTNDIKKDRSRASA